MKSLKAVLVAGFLLAGAIAALPPSIVSAQTPDQVRDGVDSIGGGGGPSLEITIETLINTFLMLIGALAVIMIIYGGFRYVTSAGEASAVSSAKNIILYAVVGLIIAASAYAISDFVIDMFDSDATTTRQAPAGVEATP